MASGTRWRSICSKLETQGDTRQLGIKVIVGDAGTATLTVGRIAFVHELPAGRESVAELPRRRGIRCRWTGAKWAQLQPSPGWTTRPATQFSAHAGRHGDDVHRALGPIGRCAGR